LKFLPLLHQYSPEQVWAGWINEKMATERAVTVLMSMVGPLVSVTVRMKEERTFGKDMCWALVVFKRKEDAGE
jgi:hypothetical protein